MSAASTLTARWETRLRPSRPRPSGPWRLLASLALHLAVLLLLLLGPQPKPPPEPMLAAPVAMMFEPPQHSRRATPHPSREASLPSPPPAPPVPPTPALRAPPAPPSPPAPAPQMQARIPQPPTPPMPLPVPPAPAPPEAAAALPRPAQPRPLERGNQKLAAARPAHLPMSASPASPQRPDMPHRQRQSAFPPPMQFSLGKPVAPRPAGKADTKASPGPAAQGSQSYGRFAEVVSGHVDASWLDQLHQWWQQHGYYPEQAVMNGEDGTVIIQIVVDRYGHVQSVQNEMRSGSQWLDMAANAVFRNAHLPPLPPDTQDKTITLNLNINYILLGK